MKIYYFEKQHVFDLQEWIIDKSGGNKGCSNDRIIYLDSTLAHVKNDIFYPTFEDKLVHIVYSICTLYPFYDANKRLSLVLGALFLELNGYDDFVEKYIHAMEDIMVLIASGKLDKSLLYEIIKSIIYEDEFSLKLKEKILKAKNKEMK